MKMKLVASLLTILMVFQVTLLCAASEKIPLTDEEQNFIEAHPVIRLGVDPSFVPFEFIDENGEYQGMTADYLALISEKTGLKFEIADFETWPEAYEMALKREVDALPAIGKTEERERHFLLSEPYYYFRRVIVTRDTDTDISDMDDLDGMTVAVQRNSSHHSYLLSFPNINLSLYDSVEVALSAVATGSEKVFIGNIATTNYLIRTTGLTNLRFVSFEPEKEQSLHFAARKDWPELINIVNKALKSISQAERLEISKKWIDLETQTDYGPVIRVFAIVSSLIAVGIIVSFFWIRRLKKEIHHRKLIQKDLEEAKKDADEANELKSSFLARMSHELRTPLNAITGLAYLLKKTDVPLTQKMYIDRITQATNNMLNIINDILDFSKIESGKLDLDIASFSMDQVIQEVVDIISYMIEEQQISFKFSKEPDVPNWFYGDSKRIEQILLNVLNNAVKFTQKGDVSLDVRLSGKEKDKYYIAFTVKDTGIGMTEAQLEKLFTPFVQGDSSINRLFGGSGLGLSIVKSLVDLMEGEIQVFSTFGEGSTFIITLPLTVDIEKEEYYIKTLLDKHFKRLRVLVLDKSAEDLYLIGNYFNHFGIQSELTGSEVYALDMLEESNGLTFRPFDLFIIDYDTPLEGGFSFVESIRNNENISIMPKIIMMLPIMKADLFEKLNEYGIDLGIGKPIIPSALLNGILDIFNLKVVSDLHSSQDQEIMPEKLDKPYRVLLAEDNLTNQLIASSLLQQSGIDIIIANNGKEAIDLYKEHKETVQLILLDLHMPIMNGYEAAERIREISKDIPIVAMTADVIVGVREKCEQYGIYHYISKPFNPERFIQIIWGILKNSGTYNQKLIVLDTTAGLKQIGGDLNVYREVLQEYLRENNNTLDILSNAINQKKYTEAAQIVHKLKSSSGSIGAKKLYEIAISLQDALQQGSEAEIELLYGEFFELMYKLLAEIRDYIK